MSDYFWDLCPRCQATGVVPQYVHDRTAGGTAMTAVSRPCEACNGLGRVKVPTGWRLEQAVLDGTYTVGSANTVTRDPVT